MQPWNIQDSNDLYQIPRWSDGYFSINTKGHLMVLPRKGKKENSIDIMDVIEEIKRNGIAFPAVLRFHDILRNQVSSLNATFRSVIKKAGYDGKYTGVYPIKVNQMREVVEEVLDAGDKYNFGLEAGSKTELMAALALNENRKALTILNGYKDADYLKLALLGRKLNKRIIIVIEKYSELIDTLALAEKMNVIPMIGFRAKLMATGSGKWSTSGGERAKFGLTTSELLNAVALLKRKKKTHYAKLFHFHIGSQITDIRTIKDAITEAARLYTGLVKMGLPLEYFDVGGGLGVDYDGSKSTADSSINYTLKDYVEDVVYILQQICDLENVSHPHIVSESGRAISARHSFIAFKAFDSIKTVQTEFNTKIVKKEHILVSNMRDLWEDLTSKNIQEVYNDACQVKDESVSAFKLGVLSLIERAKIETFFWQICKKISSSIQEAEFVPEELNEINDFLAEQYLGNFSIFQSAPDSWAVEQLFPICPINKLNEKPEIRSTLADITCDSDGKIDKFIGEGETNNSILLHKIKKRDDYYLGIFLTGAYQDVMGDMHNLFGNMNEIHIFYDKNDTNNFYIEEIIPGNSAKDVLQDMQYNPQAMATFIKKELNRQIKEGNIPPKEGVKLSDFYEKCLNSYTYLDK